MEMASHLWNKVYPKEDNVANDEGRMNMTTASKSAAKLAGCTKDCVTELTYCGMDLNFYSFYLVHNRDGQNVQVPMGTSLDEMYKALGRSLKEMAQHGKSANEPS